MPEHCMYCGSQTGCDCREIPICDKCGAPIETGMMAMLCPGREECALWPEEGIGPVFEKVFPDEWSAEDKAKFREHCARIAADRENASHE